MTTIQSESPMVADDAPRAEVGQRIVATRIVPTTSFGFMTGMQGTVVQREGSAPRVRFEKADLTPEQIVAAPPTSWAKNTDHAADHILLYVAGWEPAPVEPPDPTLQPYTAGQDYWVTDAWSMRNLIGTVLRAARAREPQPNEPQDWVTQGPYFSDENGNFFRGVPFNPPVTEGDKIVVREVGGDHSFAPYRALRGATATVTRGQPYGGSGSGSVLAQIEVSEGYPRSDDAETYLDPRSTSLSITGWTLPIPASPATDTPATEPEDPALARLAKREADLFAAMRDEACERSWGHVFGDVLDNAGWERLPVPTTEYWSVPLRMPGYHGNRFLTISDLNAATLQTITAKVRVRIEWENTENGCQCGTERVEVERRQRIIQALNAVTTTAYGDGSPVTNSADILWDQTEKVMAQCAYCS